MFFKNLSQTKKLFFIFETFILFLIIITIFLMKNLFDTNILIKEKDINKLKYITNFTIYSFCNKLSCKYNIKI